MPEAAQRYARCMAFILRTALHMLGVSVARRLRGLCAIPPLQLDTAMTCLTPFSPPERPSSGVMGLAGCAVIVRSTCTRRCSSNAASSRL